MIAIPDLVNAGFELLASVALLGHCWRLWRAASAAAVSLPSTVFFASWGFWNLFYYPSMGQWWSFMAGIAVMLVNILWIGLQVRYRV
jgi:hypothetical protein